MDINRLKSLSGIQEQNGQDISEDIFEAIQGVFENHGIPYNSSILMACANRLQELIENGEIQDDTPDIGHDYF